MFVSGRMMCTYPVACQFCANTLSRSSGDHSLVDCRSKWTHELIWALSLLSEVCLLVPTVMQSGSPASCCQAFRVKSDPTVVQLSDEEMRAIVKALMKGNADLAGPGFTGQGHFYKCPNGHPYVIGDCGGATETSRCIQCGASIGGSGHRLTGGNMQDERMRAMADQIDRLEATLGQEWGG